MTPTRDYPSRLPKGTGFGFDAIMRSPVHGRFQAYYGRMSLLSAGNAATPGQRIVRGAG
jgi:hypothetical protein